MNQFEWRRIIFDGLMVIVNEESSLASPEESIAMIDGEEGSATFGGDHVVVNKEDVSVVKPAAEIVNGEAVAAAQSEYSVVVTVAVVFGAILSASVEVIGAPVGVTFDGNVALVNDQPVIATPEGSRVVID